MNLLLDIVGANQEQIHESSIAFRYGLKISLGYNCYLRVDIFCLFASFPFLFHWPLSNFLQLTLPFQAGLKMKDFVFKERQFSLCL